MLLFDLVFFLIFFDTTQRIICEYSLKSVGGILCVLPGFVHTYSLQFIQIWQV